MPSKDLDKEENGFFAAQKDKRKDNIYLDLAKGKENWRRIALIIAFYSLIATGALIVRSFQSKFRPYVVKVNAEGMPVQFGPAEALKTNDGRLLRAELYKWIVDVRTIYDSKPLLNKKINTAFTMVSGGVSKQLNRYFSIPDNDPRNIMKRYRRTVNVRSITPVNKQKGRWKIRWIESYIPLGNEQKKTRQAWAAYLTIINRPPTSSKAILQNPLGIFITDLNWAPLSPKQ
jgi:type IV secretion system protein VirB5